MFIEKLQKNRSAVQMNLQLYWQRRYLFILKVIAEVNNVGGWAYELLLKEQITEKELECGNKISDDKGDAKKINYNEQLSTLKIL